MLWIIWGKRGKTLSFPHIATSAIKNSDLGFLELKDFGLKDSSLLPCRLFAQCVQTLMESKQRKEASPTYPPGWLDFKT